AATTCLVGSHPRCLPTPTPRGHPPRCSGWSCRPGPVRSWSALCSGLPPASDSGFWCYSFSWPVSSLALRVRFHWEHIASRRGSALSFHLSFGDRRSGCKRGDEMRGVSRNHFEELAGLNRFGK